MHIFLAVLWGAAAVGLFGLWLVNPSSPYAYLLDTNIPSFVLALVMTLYSAARWWSYREMSRHRRLPYREPPRPVVRDDEGPPPE
jgi:hypothetical protein